MSPRTTLPRATDALVEPDDPDTLARIVREKHTLLERHAFERPRDDESASASGSAKAREEGSEGSSSFAVRPPVMHFGGFELGKTHTQTFVVTNTGATSRRLVVIDPTTEPGADRDDAPYDHVGVCASARHVSGRKSARSRSGAQRNDHRRLHADGRRAVLLRLLPRARGGCARFGTPSARVPA